MYTKIVSTKKYKSNSNQRLESIFKSFQNAAISFIMLLVLCLGGSSLVYATKMIDTSNSEALLNALEQQPNNEQWLMALRNLVGQHQEKLISHKDQLIDILNGLETLSDPSLDIQELISDIQDSLELDDDATDFNSRGVNIPQFDGIIEGTGVKCTRHIEGTGKFTCIPINPKQ